MESHSYRKWYLERFGNMFDRNTSERIYDINALAQRYLGLLESLQGSADPLPDLHYKILTRRLRGLDTKEVARDLDLPVGRIWAEERWAFVNLGKRAI